MKTKELLEQKIKIYELVIDEKDKYSLEKIREKLKEIVNGLVGITIGEEDGSTFIRNFELSAEICALTEADFNKVSENLSEEINQLIDTIDEIKECNCPFPVILTKWYLDKYDTELAIISETIGRLIRDLQGYHIMNKLKKLEDVPDLRTQIQINALILMVILYRLIVFLEIKED